jgi:hypothetical protein
MRDSLVTGFALLTDDPLSSDVEHCLEPDVKVCDAISLWEITFREGNQGKVDPSRTIKIMFKNRLYFKNMVRGETEKERLLILYQVQQLAVVHSLHSHCLDLVSVLGIRNHPQRSLSNQQRPCY